MSGTAFPFSLMTIAQAVEQLQQQKVIAYPTEAVFGVGCDPQSDLALQKLLNLKQRPAHKGLILIAASIEQLTPYVDWSQLTEAQIATLKESWPAPVTWVVPALPEVSSLLRGRTCIDCCACE